MIPEGSTAAAAVGLIVGGIALFIFGPLLCVAAPMIAKQAGWKPPAAAERVTAAVRKGEFSRLVRLALRHEDGAEDASPALQPPPAGGGAGSPREPPGPPPTPMTPMPTRAEYDALEDELEEERLRAIVAERERNAAEWEKRELQARLKLNVELAQVVDALVTSVPPDWDPGEPLPPVMEGATAEPPLPPRPDGQAPPTAPTPPTLHGPSLSGRTRVSSGTASSAGASSVASRGSRRRRPKGSPAPASAPFAAPPSPQVAPRRARSPTLHPRPGEMRVYVSLPVDCATAARNFSTVLPLLASPENSVATIKRRIEGQLGVAADRLRLSCTGKPLDDSRTLRECNVRDGARLLLLLRPRSSGADVAVSPRRGGFDARAPPPPPPPPRPRRVAGSIASRLAVAAALRRSMAWRNDFAPPRAGGRHAVYRV